jgi:tRNA threonylcarbamoyladenosine biosynthesis protein TsaB
MATRTLMIEASTDLASVALFEDKALLSRADIVGRRPDNGRRTEGIVPAIVQCLTDGHLGSSDLTMLCCSGGPGGFTSLRTAASIAKGMSWALRIPLYAVSTLELIVASSETEDGVYLSTLDAGRGEYFCSVVSVERGIIGRAEPLQVLMAPRIETLSRERNATIIGPSLGVSVKPHAECVTRLMDRMLENGPVDIDTWEPMYGRLAEAQVKWEAEHGRQLDP